MGTPHDRAGDHDTVRLRRDVNHSGVFKRLHIGVDGDGGGGPRGAHTGLIPVPD